MKLVRYGRPGAECPGAIDADGKLHDLGRVIKDLTPAALAPPALKKLRAVNLARLPVVRGRPRLGCRVEHFNDSHDALLVHSTQLSAMTEHKALPCCLANS